MFGFGGGLQLAPHQVTLGRLRGEFHDWRGMQVMVTYHPAYLLRNPSMKAETWKDMQMLMRAMNIPLAS